MNTDADRNLIKQNVANLESSMDEKIVLKVTGINDLPLYTIGQVQIDILGYLTILNIFIVKFQLMKTKF